MLCQTTAIWPLSRVFSFSAEVFTVEAEFASVRCMPIVILQFDGRHSSRSPEVLPNSCEACEVETAVAPFSPSELFLRPTFPNSCTRLVAGGQAPDFTAISSFVSYPRDLLLPRQQADRPRIVSINLVARVPLLDVCSPLRLLSSP